MHSGIVRGKGKGETPLFCFLFFLFRYDTGIAWASFCFPHFLEQGIFFVYVLFS